MSVALFSDTFSCYTQTSAVITSLVVEATGYASMDNHIEKVHPVVAGQVHISFHNKKAVNT